MGPKWNSKFELRPGKWVFVPSQDTLELGQKIKAELENRWKPPSYFFHLREGGHVAALKSHLGNTSFIHIDIQNFFDSINRTRITRCLKRFFGYRDGREIANLSTVIRPGGEERKYILPYGFVQSPLLASLCLHESALGQCLKNLNRDDGVTVSVYVDDILLSTCDSDLSSVILGEIKLSAERAQFTLNAEKEEGPAAIVSAFNIELSQNSLSIQPDRWIEFLQALRDSESEHQRRGILGYVESVNAGQARQLIDGM